MDKKLVMQFKDTEGSTFNITVTKPKDNLDLDTVSEVMDNVIEQGIVVTGAGNELDTAESAYYLETTREYIVEPNQAVRYNMRRASKGKR